MILSDLPREYGAGGFRFRTESDDDVDSIEWYFDETFGAVVGHVDPRLIHDEGGIDRVFF